MQVQNILLLHNERLETIEAAATATVSSLPPQQGNGAETPCSRRGDPGSHCHAGDDSGVVLSCSFTDKAAQDKVQHTQNNLND